MLGVGRYLPTPLRYLMLRILTDCVKVFLRCNLVLFLAGILFAKYITHSSYPVGNEPCHNRTELLFFDVHLFVYANCICPDIFMERLEIRKK